MIKCDRCGQNYVKVNLPASPSSGEWRRQTLILEVRKKNGYGGFQYLDLCPECEADLEEWLKGGANV